MAEAGGTHSRGFENQHSPTCPRKASKPRHKQEQRGREARQEPQCPTEENRGLSGGSVASNTQKTKQSPQSMTTYPVTQAPGWSARNLPPVPAVDRFRPSAGSNSQWPIWSQLCSRSRGLLTYRTRCRWSRPPEAAAVSMAGHQLCARLLLSRAGRRVS